MTAATQIRPNATGHDDVTVYAEAVVGHAAAQLRYPRHELMLATTRLAQWSAERNIELRHDTVFAESVLNDFIREGLPTHTDASRGNVRAQLRRVREALHEGRGHAHRLAAAEPLAPYSEAERSGFTEWASRQKKTEFKRDARTILALGFGAGLSAGEIGEVRAENVVDDDQGVQVVVAGERARTVQLLKAYEARVRSAAKAVKPHEYLIRPQRVSTPKNLISNIVDRGVASELGPQSQRMRATWLVRHLEAGTPVAVLMQAAGLESLKGLTRYLEFVTPIPSDRARAALRR
ncbi:hypothetical protein [Leifsonia sp. NPDC058230]|uniref:hypothetical protein n=1 Tax=Leifsonia sp. NPDC058230 TaxID=3346391 RepID=UPI0036DBDD09